MLVLSRKRKQSILINDSVVVTVLKIQGDHVAIGIEAPAEVPVHRKEIFEKIRRVEAARRLAGQPG